MICSRPALFVNFNVLSAPLAPNIAYVASDSPPRASPAPCTDAVSFTEGRPLGSINRRITVSGYVLPLGRTWMLARTLP